MTRVTNAAYQAEYRQDRPSYFLGPRKCKIQTLAINCLRGGWSPTNPIRESKGPMAREEQRVFAALPSGRVEGEGSAGEMDWRGPKRVGGSSRKGRERERERVYNEIPQSQGFLALSALHCNATDEGPASPWGMRR